MAMKGVGGCCDCPPSGSGSGSGSACYICGSVPHTLSAYDDALDLTFALSKVTSWAAFTQMGVLSCTTSSSVGRGGYLSDVLFKEVEGFNIWWRLLVCCGLTSSGGVFPIFRVYSGNRANVENLSNVIRQADDLVMSVESCDPADWHATMSRRGGVSITGEIFVTE